MENQSKEQDKVQKKEEKKPLNFLKHNFWMITSIILLLALLAVMFWPSGVNKTKAGEELVTFLNERVGGGVTLKAVEDIGSLYEVTVVYRGQEIPVYITKDGKYFVQGATEIAPITGQAVENGAETSSQEIPKSDKPKIELFVMTYCPYGTMAEKGLIPVIKELGNKIDAKIRFVHYFMHGDKEEQETYTQLCIREEQGNKFLDYLSCFLEDGNSTRCLTKAGIDKAKLDSCLTTNKSKEYYESDSELSEGYGVQGSPTLIINGVEVSSGRSPAAYLSTICSAFNSNQEECSKNLSTETPSPGFGSTTTTSSSQSSGGCGA